MELITQGSIYDDRELFSAQKGANMKLRARMMDRLIEYVEENGLTQMDAAERFGVGQPRVSYLMHGKISKFTVDSLINMCTEADLSVDVVISEDGYTHA